MKKTDSKFHYTIFYSECEEGVHIIDAFKRSKDCSTVLYKFRGNNNKITYALRRLHTSWRLNRKIRLPFRFIWYDFLYHKFKNPENEIVIFFATPFFKFDVDEFFKKWNKLGIKTYAVFLDSRRANTQLGKEILPNMNKYIPSENIFSFDMADCKKYGYHYLNESYYDDSKCKIGAEIEYDLYLLARHKPSRVKEINRLWPLFKKHNIKARIDYVAIPKYDKDYYENPGLNQEITIYDDYIPYDKIIARIAKANCVLEISQPGQDAPSLRYFEAVAMNKKLLTNVEYTKKLNFYNEKFMKITNFDEKNIDFDWIKKREKVNYKYNGEFSPMNIIKAIEKLERKNV